MRSHIFVRPAKPEEAQTFFDWSVTNDKNGFDPEVATYPSTITWCAYDQKGPLAYMPMQVPLMMESLGTRPDATEYEIASALKEFTQEFVTQAHIRGAGEIYFLGTDANTDKLAKNQIFEKLPYTVYRVRLRDLEKQCESTQS